MEKHAIRKIDLVVVNLYPFQEAVAKGGDFATCIENIDIGGPAMIRASAKNNAAVSRPYWQMQHASQNYAQDHLDEPFPVFQVSTGAQRRTEKRIGSFFLEVTMMGARALASGRTWQQ